MATSYTNLVDGILTEVDVILDQYVFSGYQAFADYLATPLAALIVLYFVSVGISMSQGWTKGSFKEHAKTCFRIGLIYMFAMNWGYFSQYVVTLFYDVAGEMGDVLVSASPIPLPTMGGTGINGALQTVLTEIWKIAQWIMSSGGISNIGPLAGGFCIGLAGCFMVALAVMEMVVAKCMLSILFVTAPLFIGMTLFKPTHSFFDRWLGACVGFACLMIFVCAALGIVVALDQWVLADVYLKGAGIQISWIEMGTIIFVTLVCLGLLKRVASLAMNIGGSVTTASGHEVLAGAVGGVVGSASGAVAAARYFGNKNTLGGKITGGVAGLIMKDLRGGGSSSKSAGKSKGPGLGDK